MPRTEHNNKETKTASNQIESAIQIKLTERVEFFRSAIALLPEKQDKQSGVAFLDINIDKNREDRFCTCNSSPINTCRHIKELLEIYKGMVYVHGKNCFEENFQSSLWYRLFMILVEKNKITPKSVSVKTEKNNAHKIIKILTDKGKELLTYHSEKSDQSRFLERCTVNGDGNKNISRQDVYRKFSFLVLTENERVMMEKGYKTRKMAQEESFWYFFAYHCFREFSNQVFTLKTDIRKISCEYLLICTDQEENPIFEIPVPREKIKEINEKILKNFSVKSEIPTHPVPMEPVLDITLNDNDIEVKPAYKFVDIDHSVTYYSKESLKPYKYGNLFHIKEKNILVDVLPSYGIVNRFIENEINVISENEIPEFLVQYRDELDKGPHQVDPDIKKLNIISNFDTMTIHPNVISRDWCWLSVDYGIGECSVSLPDIMEAWNRNERFIKKGNCWVDTTSPGMAGFSAVLEMSRIKSSNKKNGKIKLSRLDLLKLSIFSHITPDIRGNDENAEQIKNILEIRPLHQIESYDGMTSTLRDYQKTGVDWIRYLYENGFGGLLCDDMGLGKTHQIMAFMLYLKLHQSAEEPFIVVCPTSVLNHWDNKIKTHVPDLSSVIYHGGNRNFDMDIKNNDVIITTYGILLRDSRMIAKEQFHLAVFDEAQFIKNAETKVYKAAKKIKAHMKLGVTGTPIENNISELKSLMDIVNPGYLGSNAGFKERYIQSIEKESNINRREELHRVIFPFILRRLKKTVLNELPEKIENITICRLSDHQIRLYHDAISSRAAGLIGTLSDDGKSIPYIHIFALLTLLKKICNHPALTLDSIEDYKKFESGKWEMFKELLQLCIESDQKIVVYSQFLGMIEIMKKYLLEKNVPFVSLTGASKNRGHIIDTFNNDPDCRVFVGSLKAGGVGFDLVSASLVIHYDRWWNAAKEDQATDRVHRIGQKKGVQVFKLVTEGTLEEKISAIIEKKRNLMDGLIKEDDPNILKTFTREELIEILSVPLN